MRPALQKPLFGFSLPLVATALTTLVLLNLREDLNTTTVALLFLIPVLVSTTVCGLWPGVFSAFAAFLTYNYYFLEPYHTLRVHQTQDIVALVIFLLISVFISQLVARTRSGLETAIARARETQRLYELSLALAAAGSGDEIVEALAQKVTEAVNIDCLEISVLPEQGEQAFHLVTPGDGPPSTAPDKIFPLETVRGQLGEFRLWQAGAAITAEEERLLKAFAAQTALALERNALADSETRARILQESDRMKSALLSSVSHEFRTPLSTIKAATTSLLSDEISWEEETRKDLLAAVDEEADYLNQLVSNLLDMSRIEAGAFEPKQQWNVLADLVDGVIRRMHRQLSHYVLEVQIPEDLPLVAVDYAQIEQVFSNILNNSVKYSAESSTVRIEAARYNAALVLVKIQNQGPQIAHEHLERIFDRFFRVTQPEKVSGIGLGLSICKVIIEAHGGQIWAENVSGGLAFFFTLPITLGGEFPAHIEEEFP